jgi:hypothetical protein
MDFNALANHYSSAAPWSSGDFNYDGTVNSLDFSALATNFNSALPASSPALGNLIPEPSMLGLLGLAGLLARRGRRTKQNAGSARSCGGSLHVSQSLCSTAQPPFEG